MYRSIESEVLNLSVDVCVCARVWRKNRHKHQTQHNLFVSISFYRCATHADGYEKSEKIARARAHTKSTWKRMLNKIYIEKLIAFRNSNNKPLRRALKMQNQCKRTNKKNMRIMRIYLFFFARAKKKLIRENNSIQHCCCVLRRCVAACVFFSSLFGIRSVESWTMHYWGLVL